MLFLIHIPTSDLPLLSIVRGKMENDLIDIEYMKRTSTFNQV